MKKIIILILVALLVGVFALVALFSPSPESNSPDSEDTPVPAVNETARSDSDTVSGKGSLSALLNRGGAFECAIVYNPGDMSGVVTGTVFTSGGKMRSDFIMNSPDFGEYVSSVIVLPDTTYTWSLIDGETYGVKMDSESMESSDTAVDPNLPVQFTAEVQYTCDKWLRIDESVFEPPADTLFRDLNQLQNAGMEYGTIYNEGEF